VATTATGQVALYYRSNRVDMPLSPSSGTFLPWLLSAKNGVIGPVWQPIQHEFITGNEWLDTEPLMNVDPNRETDGEVFLASNIGTSAVASPSPGIVKLQYIIEFRGFARNPKAALLPLRDQVYIQIGCGINTENVTAGNAVNFRMVYNNIAGTTITSLSSAATGDIYKLVLDSGSYSSGTGVSLGSAWRINYGGGNFNVMSVLNPVFVVYGLVVSSGVFSLYPTFEGAVSGAQPITYNYTAVGSSYVFNSVMASLVGSLGITSQFTI